MFDSKIKIAKKRARKYVKAHGSTPVLFVRGDNAPELHGESFYYANKSGDIISHPSAYRKMGWSSMVYHHSTLCVRVGCFWKEFNGELTSPLLLREINVYSLDEIL